MVFSTNQNNSLQMEVIYVGGHGKLATFLRKHSNFKVSSREKTSELYLDLKNINESKLLKKKECLFVIGAAISQPTKCQLNPEKCHEINFNKTSDLIEAIIDNNKILFLSTDLVFEGTSALETNDENSPPKPKSLYSNLKVQIENKFINHNNFFVARLSYVLFKNNSFISYIEDCDRQGQKPEIIHPLIRHCTSPEDIQNYIEQVALSNHTPKIFHICGKAKSRLDLFFSWCLEKNKKREYITINIDESPMKDYPHYINFKSIYR